MKFIKLYHDKRVNLELVCSYQDRTVGRGGELTIYYAGGEKEVINYESCFRLKTDVDKLDELVGITIL